MSILIPYWWVVPCLGFLYAAHRSIGVFTALRLVFYYPVVVGILKAASYAPKLFPSSFPYNPEMILKNVNYIAEGIRSNPAHRARFADVVGPCNGWRRDVGLEFEPVKERTTIKLVLSYPKKDGTNLEIRIFCKCTGMRNISIWLRGLGSAFTSVPKEIGFYAEINRGDGLVIPPTVVVPTMLFGRYNVTLDRTLLVLETLPECYATIPDFKGITFAQARVLMARSARFHGANWNPDPKKVVPYMVKRKGLDFLEVVDMYKKGYAKTYYVRVWDALKRYFEKKLDTMALCHCDCRPGNMLFRTAFWESAPAKPADDKWYDSVPDDAIIFTDWEANGVAPVMWDAAYTILTGLRLPDRRQYEAELIKHYITELRKSVPAAAAKSLADDADLMMQWRLSTVLIHFYGWTLSVIGCVGDNHGNCREDSYEWSLRTHQGVIDATVDVDAIAAALGIDAQDVRDLRADQQYLLDDLKVPAGVTKPELPFRAAFQGQQQ